MMKVYNFSSYRDNILKNGIYEISLYNEHKAFSPLFDYFIMSRGKLNSLVMIFRRYETSLYEILMYRKQANSYNWNYPEILTLWKGLIYNYRQLSNSCIYHRDIRLGKILYTSESFNQPFQFVNL